jgi:hypothetical protein
LAAQALGYGSRIYIAPIRRIDDGLKSELGIPQERAIAAGLSA